MEEQNYFSRNKLSIETALSRVISIVFEMQPENPLAFIAQELLKQAGVSDHTSAVMVSDSTTSGEEVASSGKWTARGWVASLGISPLVIDALLGDDAAGKRDDELSAIRGVEGSPARSDSPPSLSYR